MKKKKIKKEDSKKQKETKKEIYLIEKKEVREDEKRPIYIIKKGEKSKIVIIDTTKEEEKIVQKDKIKKVCLENENKEKEKITQKDEIKKICLKDEIKDKDKVCLKNKIKDKDKVCLKDETKDKDKIIQKEVKDENIIKGESGIALSFFLTRGKYKLMKLLSKKGINFKKLFDNPELQASEDLTTYIQILSDIYMLNSKLFEEDIDNDIEYRTRFKISRLYSNYKPYGIPTIEKFA